MAWTPDESESHAYEKLRDVSLGGLSFRSARALPLGQNVNVYFPLIDKTHRFTGKVVWNREKQEGFEIGLQFDDPEQLYQLRMIEQICHIEHYRQQVEQQEGRQLTSEQAAKEWISRYAGDFPGLQSE